MKIKIKINGGSKASRLMPVLRGAPPVLMTARICGTGFSREEAGMGNCKFAA
jgi:hypothetical protein